MNNVHLMVAFVCAFAIGVVMAADIEPRPTHDGPADRVMFDVSAMIDWRAPSEPELADRTYDRILTLEERSQECLGKRTSSAAWTNRPNRQRTVKCTS